MIADDFAKLLPRISREPDKRPAYFLWTFDPSDGKVYVGHNKDRHPAEHLTHKTLAPHVQHPERIHGFAYAIQGGWRITNSEHTQVKDPFIIKRILAALKQEAPPAPLPSVRYHGAP